MRQRAAPPSPSRSRCCGGGGSAGPTSSSRSCWAPSSECSTGGGVCIGGRGRRDGPQSQHEVSQWCWALSSELLGGVLGASWGCGVCAPFWHPHEPPRTRLVPRALPARGCSSVHPPTASTGTTVSSIAACLPRPVPCLQHLDWQQQHRVLRTPGVRWGVMRESLQSLNVECSNIQSCALSACLLTGPAGRGLPRPRVPVREGRCEHGGARLRGRVLAREHPGFP